MPIGAFNVTNTAQEVLAKNVNWNSLYLFNNSDSVIYISPFANPGTCNYNFENNLTDPTDCVPGKVGFNVVSTPGTDPATITTIYIATVDIDTVNRAYELQQIAAGDTITVFENSGIQATFQATGPAVDSGSNYYSIPVKFVSSVGWPPDDAALQTVSVPNKKITTSNGFPIPSQQGQAFIRDNIGAKPSSLQAIQAGAGNKELRYSYP